MRGPTVRPSNAILASCAAQEEKSAGGANERSNVSRARGGAGFESLGYTPAQFSRACGNKGRLNDARFAHYTECNGSAAHAGGNRTALGVVVRASAPAEAGWTDNDGGTERRRDCRS